jgi:hypothetical protein
VRCVQHWTHCSTFSGAALLGRYYRAALAVIVCSLLQQLCCAMLCCGMHCVYLCCTFLAMQLRSTAVRSAWCCALLALRLHVLALQPCALQRCDALAAVVKVCYP